MGALFDVQSGEPTFYDGQFNFSNGRGRLRGQEVQIGPLRRHSSVLVSSLLFVLLGVGFVVFQGGNALAGAYEALGAADLAVAIESKVRETAIDAPGLLVAAVFGPATVLAWLAHRQCEQVDGCRQRPSQDDS